MAAASNSLVATLLAMAGQRNVITIPRAFVRFTGNLESAMLLNQLLYWMPRSHLDSDSLYKTDAEWQEELCLTRYAVRQARECLVKMGFLTTSVHHQKGTPAVHYHIDYELLVEKWEAWLQGEGVKSENELYPPSGKVRKRTLPNESSSNPDAVKCESRQTMNHRVPTKIDGDDGDGRARAEKLLLDTNIYPATVRQIMTMPLDWPTVIASTQNLVTAEWGPGAIADRLRFHPPAKGHPYATESQPPRASGNGNDAPDRPRRSHAKNGHNPERDAEFAAQLAELERMADQHAGDMPPL